MPSKPTEKELHELYNGEVKIWYYPNSHRYKLDGEKGYLISASAVGGMIDDFDGAAFATKKIREYIDANMRKEGDPYLLSEMEMLIGNAIAYPEEYVTKAQDDGTALHDMCEHYARCVQNGVECDIDDLPDNPVALTCFDGFVDWNQDNELEYLELERLVYSRTHNLVGRLDTIGRLNGQKILWDYKSGTIWPKHFFQLGTYWKAYNEEMEYTGGEPVTGAAVINFNKETGKPTIVWITPEMMEVIDPMLGHAQNMIARKREFASIIKKAYNN